MAAPAPPVVTGVLYVDPLSVLTWGLQPALRRVREVYRGSVSLELRPGGAFEDLARFRREMRLEGAALGEWLARAIARTGNPVDPECLDRGRVTSSYPACRAVLAALHLDEGRGERYLRRLLEYLLIRGAPADPEVLRQCARDVGLDPGRLTDAAEAPETAEAFTRYRGEMARDRATFEEVDWRSATGGHARVVGEFRARRHEEAIDRLAPGLPQHRPAGVAEYVGRWTDLVPAREVAEVFGWSDAEAEHELEQLWRRGEVERWSYAGAAFWTGPHRPGRRGPGP